MQIPPAARRLNVCGPGQKYARRMALNAAFLRALFCRAS